MKKLKLLIKILKETNIDKIIITFIVFVFIVSILLWMFEPGITSYGDALWYSYACLTTTGFGDLKVVTLIGRLLSMFIGIYGIIVVALIPGVVVSFYMEFLKIKSNESIQEFLSKLENLENLPKEELAQISKKVRARKYKL